MTSAHILIVEDEESLTTLLRYNLEAEGFQVDVAVRGDEADLRLHETTPDLVLLDWMVPGLSGIELCRRIRARRETERLPVIMLTARGEETDRVRGLSTGADDYVVKPFALKELKARLRALLRRAGEDDGQPQVLRFADLRLDEGLYEAWRGERQLALSKTEFLLLQLFLRHPRQVLERQTIYERVWGYDFGPASNALRVYVGYLRRKLEQAGARPLIHNVRGVGYVLKEP